MADTDKNESSADKETEKDQQSKFRSVGKYFLIAGLILAQGVAAYFVVAQNYEAIYGYAQSFSSEEKAIYKLEEIIVNPANTNGKRHLLVQLSLELANKEDLELLKENSSKVRNDIITYLSAQPVQELQGSSGKENLRYELMKIINDAISSRSVRSLYYSKYVMQ